MDLHLFRFIKTTWQLRSVGVGFAYKWLRFIFYFIFITLHRNFHYLCMIFNGKEKIDL